MHGLILQNELAARRRVPAKQAEKAAKTRKSFGLPHFVASFADGANFDLCSGTGPRLTSRFAPASERTIVPSGSIKPVRQVEAKTDRTLPAGSTAYQMRQVERTFKLSAIRVTDARHGFFPSYIGCLSRFAP
ncbi:hypothetical protein NA78x_005120 [Anatilimnocola sp. NA78]|uniref:hypothetical protein n=1 Tax=Anatilimnocola sp. NA78 TaxID=3415683 RepID=UPI003CE4EB1A